MISGFESKSKQSGEKQGRANECQTTISATQCKEVNTSVRKDTEKDTDTNKAVQMSVRQKYPPHRAKR